jgi:hypothetical protein
MCQVEEAHNKTVQSRFVTESTGHPSTAVEREEGTYPNDFSTESRDFGSLPAGTMWDMVCCGRFLAGFRSLIVNCCQPGIVNFCHGFAL